MEKNAEILSDVPIRRERLEDGARIVVDLGPGVTEVSVDVLEETAIVVVEHGADASQFEMELPAAGEADTFITNGVLTIEVRNQ